MKCIRIGSRASRLAVAQSKLVMAEIHRIVPEVPLELVTMTTEGDRRLDQTLDQIGGKGLFLRDLQEALAAGKIDLCVHSLKDVPVQEDPRLPIGAYSARETPWDVLVLPEGKTEPDLQLPVGSASARRSLQFQKLHPEMLLKPVRGNVLTRLEKLDRGEYSALILAEAGLNRLGLQNRIAYRFSPEEMVPAAGQGIMAIQTRGGEYQSLLAKLNCPEAALCAKTERRLSGLLGGDCTAPIGCFVSVENDVMTLYAFYAENGAGVSGKLVGKCSDAAEMAEMMAQQLMHEVRKER